MPDDTAPPLSDNFRAAYRAWLAYEQALFQSFGATSPDTVSTKVALDELWEKLTEEEKFLMRRWPSERGKYGE